MEAEVQLKQLQRLAQQLEACEKKLTANIAQLDALCECPCSREITKKLRIQSSFLKEQAEACKDMAAVLKRAEYLYEQTEETIIQAAETRAKQYEETFRVVNLRDMPHIQVTLE